MANLNDLQDPTGGAEMDTWDVLPAGFYQAAITKTERKPTKQNPSNQYLSLEFSVADGERAGQKFWANLNLWHENPQTVEFAHKELNSIKRACGVARINDSDELQGILIGVELAVEDTNNFGKKNRIRSYQPLSNAAPQAQNTALAAAAPYAGAAQPSQPIMPAGGNKMADGRPVPPAADTEF